MRESKPLVQAENALRKISQVERRAVLGYIGRKFRLFTYTEPAKRFFINKIIVSITMNTIKVLIFLKQQAFMDIFLNISLNKVLLWYPGVKKKETKAFLPVLISFLGLLFYLFQLIQSTTVSPL